MKILQILGLTYSMLDALYMEIFDQVFLSLLIEGRYLIVLLVVVHYVLSLLTENGQ